MLMKRYPNGADADFFYQKRVPEPHPDWLDTVQITFPRFGRTADFPVVRRRGVARVDRQPRLHRPQHLADAGRARRAARLPADRPRPQRGQPVGGRARDRARRPRGAGGAGPAELPEDVGRDRPAHPRADRAGARVPRRAPVREGASRRRSSGASTTSASRRRRGRSPTASASSSTSARTRATARSPSAYSIRPTPDARASAPLRWDEVAGVDPAAFTLQTMRDRVADGRRPHRGACGGERRACVPLFETLRLEPPPIS